MSVLFLYDCKIIIIKWKSDCIAVTVQVSII